MYLQFVVGIQIEAPKERKSNLEKLKERRTKKRNCPFEKRSVNRAEEGQLMHRPKCLGNFKSIIHFQRNVTITDVPTIDDPNRMMCYERNSGVDKTGRTSTYLLQPD